MPWVKLGRVLDGPGDAPWAVSHAALPVAVPLDRGALRIYFCSRDERNRARIGSIDVSPSDWKPLGPVSSDPALDLGSLGAFDDAGVTSSWIVKAHGREHLFYTGWAVGVSVPFYFHVGVAARTGDGPFVRPSGAPLLERDAVDPYLTASPCILIENGIWRMWYVSGVRWVVADGEVRHYYHIKYADRTTASAGGAREPSASISHLESLRSPARAS